MAQLRVDAPVAIGGSNYLFVLKIGLVGPRIAVQKLPVELGPIVGVLFDHVDEVVKPLDSAHHNATLLEVRATAGVVPAVGALPIAEKGSHGPLLRVDSRTRRLAVPIRLCPRPHLQHPRLDGLLSPHERRLLSRRDHGQDALEKACRRLGAHGDALLRLADQADGRDDAREVGKRLLLAHLLLDQVELHLQRILVDSVDVLALVVGEHALDVGAQSEVGALGVEQRALGQHVALLEDLHALSVVHRLGHRDKVAGDRALGARVAYDLGFLDGELVAVALEHLLQLGKVVRRQLGAVIADARVAAVRARLRVVDGVALKDEVGLHLLRVVVGAAIGELGYAALDVRKPEVLQLHELADLLHAPLLVLARAPVHVARATDVKRDLCVGVDRLVDKGDGRRYERRQHRRAAHLARAARPIDPCAAHKSKVVSKIACRSTLEMRVAQGSR